jgi:hypothetical protein
MSLNRISFLEAWEHSRYPRGRPADDLESDEEPDVYQDLPDSPLSSSFPSTYSRLNFNPYAGPGWTESVVDDDDHNERQSTFLGLSPTTTRESHVNIHVHGHVDPARNYSVVPEYDYDSTSLGQAQVGLKEPPRWAVDETTGAFEVSPAKRIGMYALHPMHFAHPGLTPDSTGVYRGNLLLPRSRDSLRFRGSETHSYS